MKNAHLSAQHRRGVLVTRASRGVGAEVARILAAECGDRVAVHHRSSRSEAEAVTAGLEGDGHLVVQGDLSDPAG